MAPDCTLTISSDGQAQPYTCFRDVPHQKCGSRDLGPMRGHSLLHSSRKFHGDLTSASYGFPSSENLRHAYAPMLASFKRPEYMEGTVKIMTRRIRARWKEVDAYYHLDSWRAAPRTLRCEGRVYYMITPREIVKVGREHDPYVTTHSSSMANHIRRQLLGRRVKPWSALFPTCHEYI